VKVFLLLQYKKRSVENVLLHFRMTKVFLQIQA